MGRIFLFIIILYNFLFKNIKFNWIRFLFVTGVLVIIILYYISCQKIYVNQTFIGVNRILGQDTLTDLSLYIKLNCDVFSSSFYEENSEWGNNTNIFGIEAIADSSANIFSEVNFKSNSDSLNSIIRTYKELFLDKFKTIDGIEISQLINKIDAVYQISIVSTKPKYIGTIFKTIPEPFFDIKRNIVGFYDYLYEDEKGFEYNMVIGYDNNISIKGKDYMDYGLVLSDFKLFSFISPVDISKIYYNIEYSGEPLNSLSIDFGSHTEFSDMYPVPDIKDFSSIKFLYSKELDKLYHFHGMTFHAKVTDNETVQTTKMYIITTFMSAVFAYWITLFYKLVLFFIKLVKRPKKESDLGLN